MCKCAVKPKRLTTQSSDSFNSGQVSQNIFWQYNKRTIKNSLPKLPFTKIVIKEKRKKEKVAQFS